MDKYLILFSFLIVTLSQLVTAAPPAVPHKLEVVTTIYSIQIPTEGESFYRVNSLIDGRVYKVGADNTALVKILHLANETSAPTLLKLTAGNIDFIENAEILDASYKGAAPLIQWQNTRLEEEKQEATRNERTLGRSDFTPSVVDNKSEANALFDSVTSYAHGYDVSDHCYDRAHYWARSFEITEDINSMKIFLFFTPRYQKDHDYKWWFHVAPFVYVGNSEKEYVLDPTYQDAPMTIRNWANSFASESRKGCQAGKSLADYRNADNSVDCVLVQASMYHYTPTDISNGPSLTAWRCSDLRAVTKGIPPPKKKKSWNEVKGFIPPECQ